MTLTKTMIKENGNETLSQIIQHEVGDNVFLCYHCVKCTNGCPVVDYFDLTPNQVMRSVQLNDEAVLESKAIWLCASCQTCTTRCPQDLDIANVMDTLCIEAKKRGIKPAVPEIDKFSKIFLKNVDIFGRLYEVGLIAGMNMMTGQPFKDIGMGVEMLKRGKLKLIPTITRPQKEIVPPLESTKGKIGYYPGCSLHSTAAEYDQTVRAVAGAVDIELVEPPGWICCGSSPVHSTDHVQAAVMPVRTLSTLEQMGLDTVTAPCSECFARMKSASHTVAHNEHIAKQVEEEIGYSYKGTVKVQHLLDTLVKTVGIKKIKATVKKPLTGLKVACYYGCLVTRPSKITEADNPEYPMSMDNLVEALGGEPVDWSYKTDCCGASLSVTQTPIALGMTGKVLQNAHDCGADIVVAVCPLCQSNLDARQCQIGLDFEIPVLYVTQLMALAFGLDEKEAALSKNMVDPKPALREKSIIGG